MTSFVYKKSAKEKLVTVGMVLLLGLFVEEALRIGWRGGYIAWSFSLFFAIIALLIWKGLKAGYWAGKFVIGIFAVMFAGNALNPDAMMDLDASGKPWGPWIASMCVGACVCVFFYWCLQEHAKLRGLEAPPKGRPFHRLVRIFFPGPRTPSPQKSGS